MTKPPISYRTFPLLVLLFLGSGCGGDVPVVTGKVTYDGKDAGGVLITLTGTDGTAYKGTTQSNGTFAIGGVPDGDMTVTFETAPDPNAYMSDEFKKHKTGASGEGDKKEKGAPPPVPVKKGAPGMALPAKYKDAATSGQKWTVDKSNRSKNFDLTK